MAENIWLFYILNYWIVLIRAVLKEVIVHIRTSESESQIQNVGSDP